MTTPNHRTEEASAQVMYMADVAETLRDDALAWARRKLSASERDLALEKLLRRVSFCDHFKYELAREITAVLAAKDQHVESTYLYEPSANPDCEAGAEFPIDMTVHMIVKVSTPSAALEAFIASLDRSLVESLRQLHMPAFERCQIVLDAVLVTEEDVAVGRGYANLLSSIFAPPLRIWERGV